MSGYKGMNKIKKVRNYKMNTEYPQQVTSSDSKLNSDPINDYNKIEA